MRCDASTTSQRVPFFHIDLFPLVKATFTKPMALFGGRAGPACTPVASSLDVCFSFFRGCHRNLDYDRWASASLESDQVVERTLSTLDTVGILLFELGD